MTTGRINQVTIVRRGWPPPLLRGGELVTGGAPAVGGGLLLRARPPAATVAGLLLRARRVFAQDPAHRNQCRRAAPAGPDGCAAGSHRGIRFPPLCSPGGGRRAQGLFRGQVRPRPPERSPRLAGSAVQRPPPVGVSRCSFGLWPEASSLQSPTFVGDAWAPPLQGSPVKCKRRSVHRSRG